MDRRLEKATYFRQTVTHPANSFGQHSSPTLLQEKRGAPATEKPKQENLCENLHRVRLKNAGMH